MYSRAGVLSRRVILRIGFLHPYAMGNGRACSTALFLLIAAIFITIFLRPVSGNDPFQGNFPTLRCLKPRVITGCNETFMNAYEKSGYSRGDKNINKPNTYIVLYTRRNKICPEFLHDCGGRLPSNTNFRADKRVIIIIGGYISGVCVFAYFREMKDQFLFRDDYNVILTDWSWGFYPDISSSFVNAEVVANQMAFFMERLMDQTGISENNIYLIGHSVGAHIAGQAGWNFKLKTGKQIGRATGLDPAGAAYTKADDTKILDRADARYVDIIHTNAGTCFPKTIGIYKATGHADFYVNGGTYQPSCIPNILYAFLKGDFVKAFASFFLPLCFHFESIEYYKVSINPCECQFMAVECANEGFKAGKCKSCGENGTQCAVMGLDWENCPRKEAPTVYYVDTSFHCPYCDNSGINLQGFQCDEMKKKHCFIPYINRSTEICTKDI